MNELAKEMDNLCSSYSKEVVLWAMGTLIGIQANSSEEVVDWLNMISTQALGTFQTDEGGGECEQS
jgi:hypothetical protein